MSKNHMNDLFWWKETDEENQENKPKENWFAWWWHNIGSGIVTNAGEDQEEHTKRTCKAFYDSLIRQAESNEFRDEIKKAIDDAEYSDYYLIGHDKVEVDIMDKELATYKVITTIKENLL